VRLLLGSGSWGAIVPHAPALIPQVNPSYAGTDLLDSLDAIRSRQAELLVLISPHGTGNGVYTRASGSLRAMSIPKVRADAATDPQYVGELALEWGEPRIERDPDHGIVVPLALHALPPEPPVVACALGSSTGPGDSFSGPQGRAAASLAAAISTFSGKRTVGVVASAHTSAGLSPKGPLTLRPQAEAFEERALAAIATDIGGLLEIDEAAWRAGDPCGRGPLLTLAHLFQGRAFNVHSYDGSSGVGYLVASS
jgi:hypothetical protein